VNFRDPQVISTAIAIVVVITVMAFRFSRANTARPLKLEFLWIMPAWLIAVTAFLLWQMPPHGSEWLLLAVAFVIGGALGWQRGRMMAITVDPETHTLSQTTSRAALFFLVGLIALRFGLRTVLTEEASILHLSIAFVTDVFVVFAVGLLGVTRLEMYLRASRLLAQARAARTG